MSSSSSSMRARAKSASPKYAAEGWKQLRFEPLLAPRTRRCHSHIGDIILGRVQRVIPAMQAAFVESGMERAGFLPLREAKILARNAGGDVGNLRLRARRRGVSGAGDQGSRSAKRARGCPPRIALPGRFW